ncbi:aldo/keto reductase family oxidoreductase [Williamsia sp. M5A3_1d]
MSDTTLPGGTYRLGDLTVTRFGYGAMQLAGPGVFGPPADREAATAVLREAVDMGVTHIDTADFYGPHITNEIIRGALHPYPDDLHIVTKVGARRDAEGNWPHSRSPEDLTRQVHENLSHLGLDTLDVVNMRVGGVNEPEPGPIAEQIEALAALQRAGHIRHIGVSNVTAEQLAEAQEIAPIVCVQNFYNVAHRVDDPLVDATAEQGIAFVPFFPLGGFSPLQSDTLSRIATRLETTPLSVALAWLLHRSPNILLIPGTSSAAHLRENAVGAGIELSTEVLAELDGISTDA